MTKYTEASFIWHDAHMNDKVLYLTLYINIMLPDNIYIYIYIVNVLRITYTVTNLNTKTEYSTLTLSTGFLKYYFPTIG
jgi:hypothetical protein